MIKNETICPGAVMDIKSRFTVRFRDFLNVEIIVEVVFKSIQNIYKSCGKFRLFTPDRICFGDVGRSLSDTNGAASKR